ncbi:uncharacterized protein LOC113360619 [Papaver somniferum]|uniref:uncharacterized protein LOC113360619 n=1 Tax=Papaver somniferum TaxID=3469 RepID=UPI000E702F98|nr:uncharacterized protein LOC113360619 [Papaver somniferum]
MSLGDAIGKAIKVDDTTLKREIGYYASVLVEVDLAHIVPHRVLVKSKYGCFEQEIQISKIPSLCSHCKVVGHLVTECRVMRKENIENDKSETIPTIVHRKIWRMKEKKQRHIGFDICQSPKSQLPTEVVNEGLTYDEIVDVVITPAEKCIESVTEYGNPSANCFSGSIESTEEFPSLSTENLVKVSTSIPSLLNE